MNYNILCDIGNVLLRFDFRISVRRVAPMCTVPEAEILGLCTGLMNQVETGTISTDQFLEGCTSAIGYRGSRDFLLDAFQDIFEPNLAMMDLIRNEKDLGTPLYLLSNTSDIHVPYFFEKFPVFQLFDKAIYSHKVNCMKPAPEIYEKTKAILEIEPQSTLYIDDRPENIAAGSEFGFQSLLYDIDDHESFAARFNELTKQ